MKQLLKETQAHLKELERLQREGSSDFKQQIRDTKELIGSIKEDLKT